MTNFPVRHSKTGSRHGLIVLDRDGVLNRLVIDSEQGTVDSPLHPSQVELVPGAAAVLAKLTQAGWSSVVISNQPSAAKGKTTRSNLEKTHARVLELIQAEGGQILNSYICFHRSEDGCNCRKPGTALFEQAFRDFPDKAPSASWMVGDGITDIQAGQRMGMRTALISAWKLETQSLLEREGAVPEVWIERLENFLDILTARAAD